MDLNALRIFAVVADAGSFTLASKRLKVPLSTVSRKVTILEAELGARLLERSTRKLRLTQTGLGVYEAAKGLLDIGSSLENVLNEQTGTPKGMLRLSAPPSIFATILGPLVASFQSTYSQIQVELQITDRFMDPIYDRMDAILRVGPLQNSTLIANKLLTYRHQLVASPAYLENSSPIGLPSDLSAHRLLTFLHDGQRSWTLMTGKKEQTIRVEPQLSVNDYDGLAQMLVGGAGIGELPQIVQPSLLRTGKLCRVLPEWEMPEVQLYLLHSSQKQVPLQLRLFKEFAVSFVSRMAPVFQ